MDSLQFNRSVRDSVHGTILLSEEEVYIIQHELFFRLHQIRQNGLLYFIFPSATHTRFEHSLGVLNIANQAFENLLRNSCGAADKNALAESYDSAITGQAFPFHKLEESILSDLKRILRISALVHDLGHGPFSHTFDAFAPKADVIADIIETESRLKNLLPLAAILKNRPDKPRVEHEEMSCFFFTLIWEESISKSKNKGAGGHFKTEELPGIVSAIILGKPELSNNSELKAFIPLLHDLVASAPVDVDRMDYLERDSRSIGVSYGLYDRDRLLKSFLVYKEIHQQNDGSSSSACRLGIKLSGIRAVENFVQARFELFVQVYYHKTNSAISLMLEQIADFATKGNIEIFPQIDSVDELVRVYSNLSDTRFLRILRNLDSEYKLLGSKNDMEPIVSLANNVAARNLWKRVLEEKYDIADKVEKQLKRDENSEDVFVKKFEPKATKGLAQGAALLRRIGEEGIYTVDASQEGNWNNHSPMISALAKEENTIARIYYKGLDNEKLKALRLKARKLAFSNISNTDNTSNK